MADTEVQPHNRKIAFHGKATREMPRGKKRLPKGAKHFAKRGMISDKQMKKMKGEE